MKRLFALLAVLVLVAGCDRFKRDYVTSTFLPDGTPNEVRIMELCAYFGQDGFVSLLLTNCAPTNRAIVLGEVGHTLDRMSAAALESFGPGELARRIDCVKRDTTKSPFTLEQLEAAKRKRDAAVPPRRGRTEN